MGPLHIDRLVFNEKEENLALSKNDFADYVLNRISNFDDFDVSEFKKIFQVISLILQKKQKP